jgi:hypothetical protein
MAVWESDTSTNSVTTSPELNRLLGFPEDATPTIEEIRSRYAPGARERLRRAAAAALEHGQPLSREELEVIWPDGTHRWLLLRADLEASHGPEGAVIIRATGVAFDITDRKLWEDRQQLLINELNHRVKNTLATVQSLRCKASATSDRRATCVCEHSRTGSWPWRALTTSHAGQLGGVRSLVTDR